MSRAESWVIEESEVDPYGKVVRCRTKNLDHVKVMQVHESVELREVEDGKTLQTTQARIVSGFGWGMTKRIENHGLNKFKANIQRSREGVALVLKVLRESRLQTIGLGANSSYAMRIPPENSSQASEVWPKTLNEQIPRQKSDYPSPTQSFSGSVARIKAWLGWV